MNFNAVAPAVEKWVDGNRFRDKIKLLTINFKEMDRKSIILLLVIVVIAAVLGVLVYQTQINADEDQNTNQTANTNSTNTNVVEWKTYQSKTLDYSMKYPADWYADQLEGADIDEDYFMSIDVNAPLEMSNDDIWVTVKTVNKGDKTLSEIAAESDGLAEVTSTEELKFGSYSAIKNNEQVTSEGTSEGYSIVYYIEVGDGIYVISATAFKKVTRDKYIDTVSEMVKTFEYEE